MEDLDPTWPETQGEETGIFFTVHDIEWSFPDAPDLENWIREVIEEEGFELTRIDYIFCSDEFLLEVNRTHLDHDFYTDIITFPLNQNPILAEIYISIDRVKENAAAYAKSLEEELYRVMVHGILHLCGYDDHDEEDVARIRKREAFHLNKWMEDKA